MNAYVFFSQRGVHGAFLMKCRFRLGAKTCYSNSKCWLPAENDMRSPVHFAGFISLHMCSCSYLTRRHMPVPGMTTGDRK